MKKRKAILWILNLMILGILAAALYLGWQYYSIQKEYQEASSIYESLAEDVVKRNPKPEKGDVEKTKDPKAAASEEKESTPAEPVPVPPISVDFKHLKAVNEDIIGWIYIEVLGINYPVVQGKDNDDYLHKTIDKTYNFAGTLFVDHETRSKEFNDPNTIIYGHNMNDGSMFGRLWDYWYRDLYLQNPYIWIFTPTHSYRFKIFSLHETLADSEVYTLFEKHGEEFEGYLKAMKEQSYMDNQAPVNKKDSIITLTTCTGNDATRFVVQAKKEHSIKN